MSVCGSTLTAVRLAAGLNLDINAFELRHTHTHWGLTARGGRGFVRQYAHTRTNADCCTSAFERIFCWTPSFFATCRTGDHRVWCVSTAREDAFAVATGNIISVPLEAGVRACVTREKFAVSKADEKLGKIFSED
jgi:hypothetical protein